MRAARGVAWSNGTFVPLYRTGVPFVRVRASWWGWCDPRPRLASSCRRCPTPTSTRLPGSHHRDSVGMRRVARCGTGVAGWENTDPVGALRDARLTSRACLRAGPVGERGNYPVITSDVEGRDHRIVAYEPGRDGLVADGRAPASGTAARATTALGSSPHPATATGARSMRPRGPPGRPGRGGRPISVGGVGNGAPKPRIR